jgi:hypothetical protein
LVIFEKLKAGGGFANEDPRDLKEAEDMLRTFAAAEKENTADTLAARERVP